MANGLLVVLVDSLASTKASSSLSCQWIQRKIDSREFSTLIQSEPCLATCELGFFLVMDPVRSHDHLKSM